MRLAVDSPRPDHSAWFTAELYPHEALLRGWLRARFAALPDLDDIVQETFARVLRASIQPEDMRGEIRATQRRPDQPARHANHARQLGGPLVVGPPAPLVARGQTQRGQIPGGAGARSLEARTAGQIWLGLPAILKPRFKPDRVRLETNPAKRSPQCLLPTIGLGCRIGRKTIRPLVGTESRTYSSLPAMTRNQ